MKPASLALDESALAGYLAANLPGFRGPVSAKKFSGGQSNPTYCLEAASGVYVLRRKPPGKLLKSAHAVDREYRVMRALSGSDVPVPDALHLCTDESVIGSVFFVMSFEDGDIYWDPNLPDLATGARRDYFLEMLRVLAAIHTVDIGSVGLADFGKPGSYFERQVARWTAQYRASETDTIPAMEELIAWLEANLPADDGQAVLIHGDYRLDNLVFHGGRPRVRAVLDWELSTLGHPLADLAYLCMGLRLPSTGNVRGLGGTDRAAAGIPGEAELVEHYCRVRGIGGIDHWPYYLGFSFFRLAAIVQGVFKRSRDGNASSEQAGQLGRMVPALASMGVAAAAE